METYQCNVGVRPIIRSGVRSNDRTIPVSRSKRIFCVKSMDHKKAAEVLINMLDRHSLAAEEKEAILTSVGILSWTSLAQSKLKAQKARREKRDKSAQYKL